MLDIKRLRTSFSDVREKLKHRSEDISGLDQFQELDTKRRELIQESETLKKRRNDVSKQIAELKRAKKDAEPLILEMRKVSDQIKEIDNELTDIEQKLNALLLQIPNVPDDSVPIGDDEDDNVEVRKWGDIQTADFEQKPHWEVAANLGILDFERAGKVHGLNAP